MFARALRLCLCCVSIAFCATALALPPQGLTEIDAGFTTLEIIDSTAYFSGHAGVQIMSPSGDLDLVPISHPMFTATDGVTRVVKAFDGNLHVGANFSSNLSFPFGAALFRLDQPSTPIVNWDQYGVQEVGRDLTAFGTVEYGFQFVASRFLLNGTVESLAFPPGADSMTHSTYVYSATPQGYVLGDTGIPGTIGSAPAIWSPSGEFSFLDSLGIPSSIRDRADGNGVNVGWDGTAVKYGDDTDIYIENEDGLVLGGWYVVVSHSDFVVVQNSAFSTDPKLAFYPGINPLFPNRAVPLLDIFPELASIDIDYVHDLASVDGYLYMTLSGADGTFLFGARDPSAVPEPAGVALSLLAATFAFRRGRR